MTNMTPGTNSEKKLNKAIQAAIGAAQDGILGPASAVDWPPRLEPTAGL